jgi:hypothetical protein
MFISDMNARPVERTALRHMTVDGVDEVLLDECHEAKGQADAAADLSQSNDLPGMKLI